MNLTPGFRVALTPERKLERSKILNFKPGICRVTEDGAPRRGWMFCEHPECVEVIRKRNGPHCALHRELCGEKGGAR